MTTEATPGALGSNDQLGRDATDSEVQRLRAALRMLTQAIPNCVATYKTNNARCCVLAAVESGLVALAPPKDQHGMPGAGLGLCDDGT